MGIMTGLLYWDDEDTYYSQVNNPTEQILRKEDGKEWLETCGPTAAVNIIAAMGRTVKVTCPGGYEPQPEEVLSDWFHDPANYKRMKNLRDGVDPGVWMGNEIPQYYPAAVWDVFGVTGTFAWGCDPAIVKGALRAGRGVMVCLKNPGHYIAFVAYDGDEFVYRDPWPGNTWPARWRGHRGFNRVLTAVEFDNIKDYRIEIGA
jgi:hypothetical protein